MSYTERYLETVDHVPDRVSQVLSALGSLGALREDLEIRCNGVCRRINRLRDGPKKLAASKELHRLHACLTGVSDVKVEVGKSLYNMVDYHVQTLDATLASLSARMRQFEPKTISMAMAQCNAAWRSTKPPATATPGSRRGRSARTPATATNARASGGMSPGLALDGRLDTPVNPFEPTYCTCGQVAFGEMIACDADDCPVEWFHCACVGIAPSNRPKDAWFCPLCAPKQGASGLTAASAASAGASVHSPRGVPPPSALDDGATPSLPGLGVLNPAILGRGSDVALAVLGGAVPGLVHPPSPIGGTKRPRPPTAHQQAAERGAAVALAAVSGLSARLRRAAKRRRAVVEEAGEEGSASDGESTPSAPPSTPDGSSSDDAGLSSGSSASSLLHDTSGEESSEEEEESEEEAPSPPTTRSGGRPGHR